MPRVTGIAPFFLVSDVIRAAEHYRDKLDFTIRGYFFEDPPVFATRKDDALDAYIWVDDVDVLYAELQQRQADIISPPQLRIYGMKEFEVRALGGYVLCFGEEIKETAG